MFKIGEFSKLSQVSIRMLRHYDQTGLLKPARIDDHNGYRYYTSEQLVLLNKITFLRDAGFLIHEIMEILNKDEVNLKEHLEHKKTELLKIIDAEKEKYHQIELLEREIEEDSGVPCYDVKIKKIPSYPVLSLRRVIPDYYCEGSLWKELSAFAKERAITISEDTFSIYHDEDFKDTEVDVEVCVYVSAFGKDHKDFRFYETEAVETMASMMVYGPFSHIKKAYISFANWLQKHPNMEMLKGSRQIVHRGPWNEPDENKYVTEMQIPVKKR